MSEVLSTFQLKRGDKAPDFLLPDAAGNPHSFEEIAGANGIVVAFVCNHCPFVIHVANALAACAKEFRELGVATVAINSNDVERYPQDAPEKMAEFAEEYSWDFPYLFDENQSVALAYGAACTPDFFLFDSAGALVYAGQFDHTRPKSGQAAHGGDLSEAVRRMVDGEAPLERPYPSNGCNIKWKAGRQPPWWDTGGASSAAAL